MAASADNPQDAAIYKVAAFTGLRQGELLALRWGCVDFVDGLLHVRRNYTGGVEKVPKGKRVRSVPMMPAVIDALAELKNREHFTGDDDLVFCSTVGDHVDHFALRRRYYDALDRANLRRIRFHDLRHTHATLLLQAGISPKVVSERLGHATVGFTMRVYAHVIPGMQADAA